MNFSLPPLFRQAVFSSALGALILLPLLPGRARAQSALVGTLPTTVSVDNHGSANCSIPLPTSPGRGGMEPKLSLNYSSGSGNGPLGFGFSLSTGFPQSITRGRSILARDGVVQGVTFTASDKFYLDGKRLICINSVTNPYGTPGSIYRTEVDSFVTITTAGTGSNIETFTVTDKNGVAMTFGKYGTTTDGYQMGAMVNETLAYTYALKHVQDTLGNAVDLSYTEILNSDSSRTGEYVLASISYTANPVQSVAAAWKVSMSYNLNTVGSAVARTDATSSYVANRAFGHTQRLDEIDVMQGTTKAAAYLLGYEYAPSFGLTRLKTITGQLLDPVGKTLLSLPATTIQWSNEAVISSAVQSTTNVSYNSASQNLTFADFDGDGKTDCLSVSGSTLAVSRGTGSGFAAATSWGTNHAGDGWGAQQLPGIKVLHGDFDGDGRTDILYINSVSGISLYALKSNGSSFVGLDGSSNPTLVANLNSIFRDPISDPNINTYQTFANEGLACYDRITVADFNGDGRDDILIHSYDGHTYVFTSTGTGFTGPVKSAQQGQGFTGTPQYTWYPWTYTGAIYPPEHYCVQPIPCDLDGDGKADYAAVVTLRTLQQGSLYGVTRFLELRVSLGNGDFTLPTVLDYQGVNVSGSNMLDWLGVIYAVMPCDVNGDGLTDFLVLGDGKIDGNSGNPNAPPKMTRRRWTLFLNQGVVNGTPSFQAVPGPIPNTITANGESLNTFYSAFTGLGDSTLLQPQMEYNDSTYKTLYPAVESSGGAGMKLVDINGDGIPDLVWYACTSVYSSNGNGAWSSCSASNLGWWVMYGNGHADANGYWFSNPVRLTVPGRTPATIWEQSTLSPTSGNNHAYISEDGINPSTDVNGDGRMDWISLNSSTNFSTSSSFTGSALASGIPGNLVTSTTDGVGRITSLGYKAAKDDTVYTPGAAVSYPIREIRGSNFVVSDLWQDSGVNGAPAQFSYQYSGNRLDLAGRGPLGFHSFITLDRQTNLFKYQFLTQSFPMTGLAAREQSYRYWESTSGTPPSVSVNFRTISSHDNTVVFDSVTNMSDPNHPAAWGTVYPFISQAVESRWEDASTAHFTWTKANQSGGPQSSAELLFPTYGASKPSGAHITITTQSWFDNQPTSSGPQTTLPTGFAAYQPSDTNSSGANIVVGTATNTLFTNLPTGKITYGNLVRLRTDYGGGYGERVDKFYAPATSNGLTGLVQTSQTFAWATGQSTETSPEASPKTTYGYFTNGTTPTPLVASETTDASVANPNPSATLSTTKSYSYDNLGRLTATSISGTDLQYTGQGAVSAYNISSVPTPSTDFDARFDLPTKSQDAYSHVTTTVYDQILGEPTSVTDVNGAQVTTQYDAMGRTINVTDVLKNLTTTQSFAWDNSQTVAPPSGWNGVASGASITGVNGVSLTSAYKVTTTATAKPNVTAYYDRLGRVIRTAKDGFNGLQVFTDTAYNSLGQVIATSLPYPSGGKPLWTKTTYDALGRVVTVAAPNGTVTTNTYIGRATKVSVDAPNLGGIDPAAQVNTTLVDAKGRTVSVWNADNVPSFSDNLGTTSTTPSISFALDGFGRMRTTSLLGQTQTITATYDALGRQLTLNDPDKGVWSYTNSALGQVLSQTDARGASAATSDTTTNTYDRLDRPLIRSTTGNGSTETANFYYYDTAATIAAFPSGHLVDKTTKGWIGAPEREDCTATGSYPTTNLHYYDSLGRPSIEMALTDGKWFYTYTDYDAYSRPREVRHYWKPSGAEAPTTQPYLWQDFGYVYTYDNKSYLLSLTDTLGRSWWDSPVYDYMDRVVSVRRGSGATTTRIYRPEDGVLTTLNTGGGSIQNLTFNFDGLGNLTSRSDANASGGSESLGYDNLNRLTSSKQGAISYLANGNINTKPDVSGNVSAAYSYGPMVGSGVNQHVAPHAVATAFGYTMSYDGNGNLLSRLKSGDNSYVSWTGFDKPRWMTRAASPLTTTAQAVTGGSEFHYNANRARVMQLEFNEATSSGATKYVRKRVYAMGSTLELNYTTATPALSPTWNLDTVRIYVPGPDGIIGAREFRPAAGGAEKALVYHYDHLGSITAITDFGATSGLSVTGTGKTGRYSEDAWGQRRNAQTWNGVPAAGDDAGSSTSLTPRGFTGHEMLDDLGLVHMNGRIYDPLLGRFLSADVLVQAPGSLQSFNRYSYVMNNPLALVDPSGFTADQAGSVASNDETLRQAQRRDLQKRADAAARSIVIGERGITGYLTSGSYVDGVASAIVAGVNQVLANIANGGAHPSEQRNEKAAPSIGLGDTVKPDTAPTTETKTTETKDSTTTQSNKKLDSSNAPNSEAAGGSEGGALDNTGRVLGALGATAGLAENVQNGEMGFWIGKNWSVLKTSWGGNGATGGRLIFAGRMASYAKTGGNILGGLGIGVSALQGYDAFQKNNTYGMVQAGADITVGVVGFFGPVGWAGSTGYFGGQQLDRWFGITDKVAKVVTADPPPITPLLALSPFE